MGGEMHTVSAAITYVDTDHWPQELRDQADREITEPWMTSYDWLHGKFLEELRTAATAFYERHRDVIACEPSI